MASGALNLLPACRRWWSLDGKKLPYWGIPAVVAALVAWQDVQIHSLGALVTASTFFTAILVSIMFQVYSWVSDAPTETDVSFGASWVREKQRRRLRAMTRIHDSLVWATLVSLALTTLLIGLAGAGVRTHLRVWTPMVFALSTHLILVMLAILNRLFNVTSDAIDEATTK